MGVADLLLLIPAVFFAAMTAYLVLVTVAALFYRKPGGPAPAPAKMAVIMPAHNEAGQIAGTVHSAQEARGEERVDIFVIADNCTDATATLAREAGAEVFERSDLQHRGKGQALDWCLRTHANCLRAYDILILIDADVNLSPGYFGEIARDFAAPCVQVVQTHYGVANPGDNWRTALTYAGFALMNHVRPAGRCRLGGTAGLKGTGMAFRSGVLLRYGWPAHSIVEDIEFGALLLHDGIRVQYDPAARHVSAMPATRAQAESQRRRWEAGRMHVLATHVPGLLTLAVRRFRWDYLDAALDLAVPPLSLLAAGQGVFLAAAMLTHSFTAWIFTASSAATIFHVVAGLAASRAPARVYLYLFSAPLFLFWKIPLYLRLLIAGGDKTWVRTSRENELERKPGE